MKNPAKATAIKETIEYDRIGSSSQMGLPPGISEALRQRGWMGSEEEMARHWRKSGHAWRMKVMEDMEHVRHRRRAWIAARAAK